jgi:AraC-like DNA-binding protein
MSRAGLDRGIRRQSGGPIVPTSRADTVSTRLPRLVLTSAIASGADVSRLSRRVGLDMASLDDAEARVPFEQERLLWSEVAAATGDPCFGLHLGAGVRRGQLDVFEYVCRSATTFGESLEYAARYIGLLHDRAEFRVQSNESTFDVIYRLRGETRSLDRHMVEFTLATLLTLTRNATGQPHLAPRRVGFAHAPSRSRQALADVFGTTAIDFSEPECCLTFDRAAFALPLLGADVGLCAVLRRHADVLLAARVRTISWTERVADRVLRPARGTLSLSRCAQALRVTPRTLQRRLEEEGSIFCDVLENVRRQEATRLLTRRELSIATIGAQLGYADARAFRRAFIRWMGVTPQSYRTASGEV